MWCVTFAIRITFSMSNVYYTIGYSFQLAQHHLAFIRRVMNYEIIFVLLADAPALWGQIWTIKEKEKVMCA